MDIEIRYFDDCPNWQQTEAVVREVLDKLGAEATVVTRPVENHEEAIALEFRGSPTVLINGTDPFLDPDAPFGLSCRIYPTDDGYRGTPPEQALRAAIEGSIGT